MAMTMTREHHLNRASGEGRRLRVLTDIVEIKLSGAETNGAFELIESHTPPQGGAAMLHTHPPQEPFVVVEGTFEFGGVGPDRPYTVRAGAGSVVHIPAGAPHGYQNVGDGPGRILMLFEPAGIMLDFFEELHAVVDSADPLTAPMDDLPSMERILEICARHGLNFLPPAG
jgi:quercetin dioxygenase-like cupin family protein